MSTTRDYGSMKYSVLSGMDASGEVNLEGIAFPKASRPSGIRRLARRLGRGIMALLRALAHAIRETPAEYNARMARNFRDQPPVRGLR